MIFKFVGVSHQIEEFLIGPDHSRNNIRRKICEIHFKEFGENTRQKEWAAMNPLKYEAFGINWTLIRFMI